MNIMSASQRSLVSLGKKVTEKVENIRDQRHLLSAILDEYIAESERDAESLLAITDKGQFMQSFVDVMQNLDRCYNTCFLLTTEAENLIEEAQRASPTLWLPVQDSNKLAKHTCKEDSVLTVDLPVVSVDKKDDVKTESCRPCLQDGGGPPPSEMLQPTVLNVNLNENATKPAAQKHVWNIEPDDHTKESHSELKQSSSIDVHEISGCSTIPNKARPRIDMDVAKRHMRSVIKQAENDNSERKHRKTRRIRTNSRGKQKVKESEVPVTGDIDNVLVDTQDLQNFSEGNTASKDSKDICAMSSSETTSQKIDLLSEKHDCSLENICMSTQNTNVPPQNSNASAHKTEENLLSVEDSLNKLDKPNASENAKLITSEMKTKKVCDETNECDSNVNAYVSFPVNTSSVDQTSAVPPQTSNSFDTALTPEQNLCQATVEEGLSYGLGPTLTYVELCVGQPVTVEVLEPTSPWKFYIQQVGFGLDKLMEQIFSYMIKHGEDNNLIKKPEKNMTCLAKYSQDGLYYRARVMQVYPSQGTEIPVDILYVDYGNREEGTSAHLRELPERFTSLPIQAVQCALAKVAPVNKYNVWTEEDISAFTQFVYGQSFSCVCVGGAEEGLPHLIELYLYIPRPTVTGGQLYIHNTVSTVNISTVLVNQGRARDTAITDQLVALRRMYKPSVSTSQTLTGKTAVKQMSDTAKVPQQSNTASSSGQTSSSAEKGKIPRPMKLPRPKVSAHKNKVMSVKSIVAAASGVTSESGMPDTLEKVKQGGFVQKDLTTQHKVTSEGHPQQEGETGPDNGTVLSDTEPDVFEPREADAEHSKCDVGGERQEGEKQTIAELPNQDKVSSDEVQPNQNKDSTDTKKSSEGDQNSEEDQGNIEVITPTPQSSVPDNSSTSTTANETQSIADFLADLPVANIKIPNILQSDDQMSVISSDGCSASLEKSSCRNIDLCSKCFNVMLSHVISPEHFYIHIVSETVGKTLDNMMKNLNHHFEQIGRKKLQQLNRSYTPRPDDLCCARFSGDNFFYRAVVTDVVASESSSSPSKVHVFYLDFGDREWLPRWKLFPLPEEFKDTPPLALSCSLAYIKPVVTSQDSNAAIWPANVTQEFIKQVGFENPIQMIVLSGTLCFDMKRNPDCGMVDSAILKVFLVSSEEEEEVCINMDLIRLGLATIDSGYSQEIGLPNALGEIEIGDWDPMAEDYLSIRNSYNIDVDDPGVATVQYKAQDEKQICKYFSNNSCWRGDRCPYRHVQVTGGVTMDREPVYGGLDEAQIEALLPDCDTCVAIEISTIINPAHFYIILPWGKRTLDSLLDPSATDPDEDEETLDELVNSLQSHYGNMSFSQKTLVHYAEGELVVARFVQDGRWYRAKVLRSDDRERETRIQVFYVDFGNKEWVSERDIKSMEPQFLHLPFQAIECFLVDIEPAGHSDQFSQKAKKMFQQMTDGKTLVAYIKSRSWSGCLYIDLFDTSSEEDINIGKVLISQGLAQVPRPHSDTSLTSRSGSEGSLLLIPG